MTVMSTVPWQVPTLLSLSVAALLALLVRAWFIPARTVVARRTPAFLYLLRLGACFCVFFSTMGLIVDIMMGYWEALYSDLLFHLPFIALAGITLLAFLPDDKIKRKRPLLIAIGLLEAAMLSLVLFSLFTPM